MNFSAENILDIALIFEQDNGNTLNNNDSLLAKNSGLHGNSPEEIEFMLIESISQGKSVEYRGSAYWALGKRYNKKLIPMFKQWLAEEVSSNETGAIYQLLIALDNLEEPVFGKDRDGYSAMDMELNTRDANIYLEKYA